MSQARVRGRPLMIAILLGTAAFGVALWYFQTRAFYEEIEADSVTIAGQAVPVSDFRGIDASTSPLKLRACFRLDAPVEAPPAPDAEPLVAPGWFDCFDAREIAMALASGEAAAWLAAEEEFDGIHRIVARLPDGRAYMWRQLDERFAE